MVAFAVFAGTCFAADSKPASAEEMRAPSSPAFALVGVSPTRIERPASARAFGLSLLSATSESSSGIPRNLAFEFAPYWWTERPDLTVEDMEGGNPWENMIRTASFSIATFERAVTGSSDPDTGAGLGLHFDLIRGTPAAADQLLEKLGGSMEAEGPDDVPSPEQTAAIREITRGWDASRVGHQLSMSAAASWRFQGDGFDQGQADRIGGWLTYAYKTPSTNSFVKQFTFLGTGRVLGDLDPTSEKLFWDVGARLHWRAPRHPLTVSGEYMRRFGDAESDSLTAMIQYEIKSGVFLFASHGGVLEGDRGLGTKLTLFGLSFGWGPKSGATQ
jgi:hypothetical protein